MANLVRNPYKKDRKPHKKHKPHKIKKTPVERLTPLAPDLDLVTFSEKYFGMENNWHHRLMYDILDNFVYFDKKTKKFHFNKTFEDKKPDRYKWGFMQREGHPPNKTIQILVPRHHGKSTAVSFIYPIYEICRNPNVRILIVSANEEISKSFVRQVLTQLENNEELIKDFGPFAPRTLRKWGEKALIVKRDTIEKDPTLAASGLMERIVSKRADIIILDDIIDLERSRTDYQREKVMEWFNNVLYPILDPNGRIVVVGTKWFKGDFYDAVEKEKEFDIKLKLKALVYNSSMLVTNKGRQAYVKEINDKKLPYDPFANEKLALDIATIFDRSMIEAYELSRLSEWFNTGVLWGDKWDYESLMNQKKIIGEAAFYRQYLNEPVSPNDGLYKKTYVDSAFERGKKYSMPDSWDNVNFPQGFPHRQMAVMMGVDLAASVNKKSDFSAIAVWGLDSLGYRWLLYLDKFKGSLDEIKQRILDVYYLYNPLKVVVESNVFQDLVRQELEAEINVVGMKTTQLNKFDFQRGLSHLAILFEQEKIIVPSGGKSKIIANKFYRDLLATTIDGHTPDTVMASWFALYHLKEYDEMLKESSGYISRDALAYQSKFLVSQNNKNKIIIRKGYDKYKDQIIVKYSYNSIVNYFGDKHSPIDIRNELASKDAFFIVSFDDKALAYVFDRTNGEILLSIDGNVSILFFADLLKDYTPLFRSYQMAVIKNGGGEGLLYQLQQRELNNIYCMIPNKEGLVDYATSVHVDSFILPSACDFLKYNLEKKNIVVKDKRLIKEMSEVVDITGDKVDTINQKTPQHFITFAVGYYLLMNFNLETKKTPAEKKRSHFGKALFANPYKIFNT